MKTAYKRLRISKVMLVSSGEKNRPKRSTCLPVFAELVGWRVVFAVPDK
jgi:hypothetical protein